MTRIRLNPDREYAKEVRKKIKDNGGYCPCCLEKTKDTKCMCKDFKEQTEGMCRCGLYIKDAEDSE